MSKNETWSPYDPRWPAFYAAHPGMHRPVGADAAADDGGDGGEVAGTGNADAAGAKAAAGEGGKAAGEAGDRAGAAIGDGAKKPDVSADDVDAVLKDEDWRADLPDDLRKVADRFTSKADAIRAIADLRKRESQARVPGKNATDEEVAAYRKAIGVPEAPDGYEFPAVEGQEVTPEIEAARGEWAKTFHDLNIPADAAKALIERVQAESQVQLAAQIEADKRYAKEQEDSLRAEWKGEDFDKNKTLANRAFTEVANRAGVAAADLTKIETKDGRFLLDDARMLRVFAAIGREMAEGTLGPSLSEGERDTLEGEIESVRSQIKEAQAAGNSKKANALYQREQALLAKMGNKPIIGAQGRAA